MIVIVLFFAMGPHGTAHAERPTILGQANRSPIAPFAEFINEASRRFGVPAHWIRVVMHAESAGDVRAVSPKGAMGLMQIMPDTWAELSARYHLGGDPYDPRDNILAGAAYLREMHDRYGSPAFLAAYNAGPARYEEHLATGRGLPVETQAYVAMLAPMIASGEIDGAPAAHPPTLSWRQSPLFVEHAANDPTVDGPSFSAQSSRRSSSRAIVDLSALGPQSDDLFVRRVSRATSQ